MTNVEKYLDSLKYIWEESVGGIAINKNNGKPVACLDIACKSCLFLSTFEDCTSTLLGWMFDEAKEETE